MPVCLCIRGVPIDRSPIIIGPISVKKCMIGDRRSLSLVADTDHLHLISQPACAAGLLFPSHCANAQQQILSDVVWNYNALSEWRSLRVAAEN